MLMMLRIVLLLLRLVLLCLVEAQSATHTFPAAATSRIPFFFLPWRMMDGLHFQVPTSSPTHQKHAASKQIKLVFLSSSFLSLSLSLLTHGWLPLQTINPASQLPTYLSTYQIPQTKTQIQHTTLTLIKNNLRHAHNTQQQNINHECSASQLLTTKTCSFAPTNTTLVLGSTQQIRSKLMLNLLITTQQTKLLNQQQPNFEPTTPTTTPNNTQQQLLASCQPKNCLNTTALGSQLQQIRNCSSKNRYMWHNNNKTNNTITKNNNNNNNKGLKHPEQKQVLFFFLLEIAEETGRAG